MGETNTNLNIEKFRLHFITNQWSDLPIPKQVEKAIQGGCKWIQLRLKNTSNETFLNTALEVKDICKRHQAAFIVNDQIEIAIKTDADGIHLGKEDIDPKKARQLLGSKKIIGATANTLDEIVKAHEKGADYIGLGPFRQTATKQKLAPVLGLEGYKKIIAEMTALDINLPVAAIGGITKEDIKDIITTGISGVAVSSEISHHPEPTEITRKLITNILKHMPYAQFRQ
ncbi:MAG: thiamine phosphate synthase [Bacteroidota bacterium]